MIDLYTWGTPNGKKASIGLEEVGLPYRVHPIDISKGDQKAAPFLAINPNGRIPAIVDNEAEGGPLAVFESGAILIYLADKSGKFLAPKGATRYQALEWLMWQMGGLGPMAGQAHHFLRFAPEKVPYGMERFKTETRRLYGVMDGHLAKHEYLAGDYTIADMACFPWIARHEFHEVDLADFANVKRWHDAIAERPAVQRGMKVPG